MSQKCRKLQLRTLVGRFGSQNAMVGRLDDLGAEMDHVGFMVREGFNDPSHGNFLLGGSPLRLRGHHGQDFPEKLAEIS